MKLRFCNGTDEDEGEEIERGLPDDYGDSGDSGPVDMAGLSISLRSCR